MNNIPNVHDKTFSNWQELDRLFAEYSRLTQLQEFHMWENERINKQADDAYALYVAAYHKDSIAKLDKLFGRQSQLSRAVAIVTGQPTKRLIAIGDESGITEVAADFQDEKDRQYADLAEEMAMEADHYETMNASSIYGQ